MIYVIFIALIIFLSTFIYYVLLGDKLKKANHRGELIAYCIPFGYNIHKAYKTAKTRWNLTPKHGKYKTIPFDYSFEYNKTEFYLEDFSIKQLNELARQVHIEIKSNCESQIDSKMEVGVYPSNLDEIIKLG